MRGTQFSFAAVSIADAVMTQQAIKGIRKGLRAVARGKTKAAGKAMDDLRRKHAISR